MDFLVVGQFTDPLPISSVLGIHLTQLITKRKSCGAGVLAGLLGGRTRASAAVQGDRPTSAPNKSWPSQMDTQLMKWPALRRWAAKTGTSSRCTSRPSLQRRTSWSAASLAQAPAHRYFTLQLAPVEQLAAWYVTRAELAKFQPYFRLFGLLLRNMAAAIDRSLFCWFRHKSIISPDK